MRKARIIEVPKAEFGEFYSLYKLQYQYFGFLWITIMDCTSNKELLIDYHKRSEEHKKKIRKIVWDI